MKAVREEIFGPVLAAAPFRAETVDAAPPFGGYKESGWSREMGHAVFNNYLETKTVITDLS